MVMSVKSWRKTDSTAKARVLTKQMLTFQATPLLNRTDSSKADLDNRGNIEISSSFTHHCL